MSYLIDTDWLSPYLKGRSEAVALLSSLRQEDIYLSLISYGEIYEGIYSDRDPKAKEQGFLLLLRRMPVLPLTRTIMKRFAALRGELRRQGMLIPDADLLIAAIALVRGLTLVTRNLRHFQRVPDLVIYTEA